MKFVHKIVEEFKWKEIFLYALVGVSATTTYTFIYEYLLKVQLFSSLGSHVISSLTLTPFSYLLHKKVTFSKKKQKGEYWRKQEFRKFLISVSICFTINSLFSYMLVDHFKLPTYYYWFCIFIITPGFNFLFLKFVVFED